MTGHQGGPAVQAFDHAAARDLPPLEQTLAADAARGYVEFGDRERAWLATKAHLAEWPALVGIPNADQPDRLAQAVATLKQRGVWPW